MKRLQKSIIYSIQIVFICMMCVILTLIFFFSDIEYACKRIYPNGVIFAWILLAFFYCISSISQVNVYIEKFLQWIGEKSRQIGTGLW